MHALTQTGNDFLALSWLQNEMSSNIVSSSAWKLSLVGGFSSRCLLKESCALWAPLGRGVWNPRDGCMSSLMDNTFTLHFLSDEELDCWNQDLWELFTLYLRLSLRWPHPTVLKEIRLGDTASVILQPLCDFCSASLSPGVSVTWNVDLGSWI